MSDSTQIREWWAEHPMTYGDEHGRPEWGDSSSELGTREFFQRVDDRFFEWNAPLHGDRPFSRLFDYGSYGDGKVLEVGCGMGSMAMQWALAGARMTAVDLNPTAIAQTRRRFEVFGLDGDVREADARTLPFEDDTFDYAYSWGVLHHSPELNRSIEELLRVVRPGGGFGIMLYNRRSFLHWYMTEYVEGILHMERRFLDAVELASRYGDAGREEGNPHTWPVTREEVVTVLRDLGATADARVLGTDIDGVLGTAVPGLHRFVPAWAKKPWARRFGWSLWFHGHKA